jgi:hypothetical protein
MLSGKHGGDMAIGLYKIKDGWANEDSVWVRYDDGKQLEIPASQYVADGYEPPIDDLEWKDA